MINMSTLSLSMATIPLKQVSILIIDYSYRCKKLPFFDDVNLSSLVPREGCLLGCAFYIADYPSIVSPRLISAWVRVIREHGGQVLVDPSQNLSSQPKADTKGQLDKERQCQL
jgi:hypothetical protein